MISEQSDNAMMRPGLFKASIAMLAGTYLVFVLITIWPLFDIAILPLIDYPNHLARMHILTELPRSQALQDIWSAEWRIIPNLAADLIVPPLARLTGVLAAMKIFFAMSQLMPVAGVLALRWALTGRIGYEGLAGFVMAWTLPLAWGFLNFSFSLGLALILLAGWIRWRETPYLVRLAGFNLAAMLIYLCHILGLVGFIVMLACFELGRARQANALRPDRLALRALPVMAMIAGPVLIHVVQAWLTQSGIPAMHQGSWFGDALTKYYAFMSAFYFYGGLPDLLVMMFVAGTAVWLWRRGRIEVQAGFIFTILALAVLLLVIPTILKGVYLDGRLGVLFMGLVLASFTIKPMSPLVSRSLMIGWGCVMMVLSFSTWSQWRLYDDQYSELRQAIDLPDGSRLLSVHDVTIDEGGLSYEVRWRMSSVTFLPGIPMSHPYRHASSLALLDNAVFVPEQFTHPSAQPLRAVGRYADLDPVIPARRLSDDLFRMALDPAARNELATVSSENNEYLYWLDWPTDFDFVIVYRYAPENRVDLPMTHLELIVSGSFFDLYRIIQPD